MAQEGNRTTVIESRPHSSGAGVIAAVALLIAVVAGVYFFGQISSSEANKNNAVAGAADSVSDAVDSAGSAAKSGTE